MYVVWQMAVDEEMRRHSEGKRRRVGARARAAYIRRALDNDPTF